jgi:hypothetical protein
LQSKPWKIWASSLTLERSLSEIDTFTKVWDLCHAALFD